MMLCTETSAHAGSQNPCCVFPLARGAAEADADTDADANADEAAVQPQQL